MPKAVIGGPTSGLVGETLGFSGADSTDEDGRIVGYIWDFGDGAAGTGVTVTHVYNAAGSYKVTLTVTDDEGGINQVSAQTQAFTILATYTVQSGDTLMEISRKLFNGDAQYWDEIAYFNNITAPYTLYRGQILRIPNLQEFGLVSIPTPTLIPPGEMPPDLTLTLAASPTAAVTPTATPILMPTDTPTPAPTPTQAPIPRPLGLLNIWDVVINPKDTKEIYVVVGGEGRGIYKTIDGGISWGLIEGRYNTIECLAIDPKDPQILYAGLWEGILKSTDGGANWKVITALEESGLPFKETVHTLAIVPDDSRIIYAGTGGGVYKSLA